MTTGEDGEVLRDKIARALYEQQFPGSKWPESADRADAWREMADAVLALIEPVMEENERKIATLQTLLVEYGDRVRMARAEPAEKQWIIDEAFSTRTALSPKSEKQDG
jgi:hypothetical protein